MGMVETILTLTKYDLSILYTFFLGSGSGRYRAIAESWRATVFKSERKHHLSWGHFLIWTSSAFKCYQFGHYGI